MRVILHGRSKTLYEIWAWDLGGKSDFGRSRILHGIWVGTLIRSERKELQIQAPFDEPNEGDGGDQNGAQNDDSVAVEAGVAQ